MSIHPLIIDLGREYRGGQHQALLLLKGLRSRGHAPELIAVQESLLAQHAINAGIPVHSVSAGRRRVAAMLKIRRLLQLRRSRIDLIHANEPHALSSAWLARAHGAVPVVASRRIALPLSPDSVSLARYRSAARIVAVSHFVEESVVASGLSARSVSVVYDGVEFPPPHSSGDRENARRQLGISPKAPCLGNIAAFVPEKGHAILLEAFAELHAHVPESVLLLRGEGPKQSAVQELAKQLQIRNAVKFLPPDTAIEAMFGAMDVFVFPSHEEPLGSALLAAMAHGLPVVAIDRGGIPEVVESEKNGLLVDGLDATALSAAMARLIGKSNVSLGDARRFGIGARETVAARFSADRMVDATVRIYEELLGERT